MNILDKLTKAIKEKKVIEFEYNKPEKTSGKRIGNPYAVFILTAKDGRQSTKVHLVQTDGVSDSKTDNPFPEFRMFNIEELSNMELRDDTFSQISEKYNPEWEGYKDVIEKI
ncbi:WYL domain-containing protein [Flavobacterium sp. PL02]|uniref:WYL domain-containing protein n=1 Tax=Flavobacterium sp. PL02 TaxID=3088354 RepID=UPI002B23E39C|nr:WYL domain-containing protein [Flavobacterium sp. PL02]MEA9415426.1 WYL domain-containing protein [Flavobacterium sp. PL02]